MTATVKDEPYDPMEGYLAGRFETIQLTPYLSLVAAFRQTAQIAANLRMIDENRPLSSSSLGARGFERNRDFSLIEE